MQTGKSWVLMTAFFSNLPESVFLPSLVRWTRLPERHFVVFQTVLLSQYFLKNIQILPRIKSKAEISEVFYNFQRNLGYLNEGKGCLEIPP